MSKKDEALRMAREELADVQRYRAYTQGVPDAIAAIDAALAEPQGGMPGLPEPNLPEGDWFIRNAYIKEYAKQYGRACAEAARMADEALMLRALTVIEAICADALRNGEADLTDDELSTVAALRERLGETKE